MSRSVPRTDVYSRLNLLERQVRDLASALTGGEWTNIATTPGYATGWSDVGSGNPVGQFRLGPGGMVQLRGNIKGPNVTSGSSTIFTLPAGYRPSGQKVFPAPDAAAFFTIAPTGAVTASPLNWTAGQWLDAISFALN